MNQPVVPAIGNAVEIRAVMEVLTRGAGTSRIEALVVELGGTLLAQSGLAGGVTHGRDMILKSLVTRQAAETVWPYGCGPRWPQGISSKNGRPISLKPQ